MAKYNFKFGKYWLSEFGAVSAEEPTIEIAQRDVTFITVPGKDGKDCVDNGNTADQQLYIYAGLSGF